MYQLFDVLEHIPNIRLAINKIYKLVKKDGFLIINVPDHNSLARKILKRMAFLSYSTSTLF